LRERQPLVSASADLVLTADARLDNRDELCSLLPAPCGFTDAELILAAYERWAERCPEHLLGDFAFAIWDARRQIVFCARDHFGVKPFYYHHRPGRLFALASEIKGLLALPDVPRRLNETRVADYLVPLLEDKVITFYEDIVRLPPAHRMMVTREAVRIERYWALDPEREIHLKSDAEYAAAFREIFTEAVRCRLRSAFPVGSMLSGGLDSSSIVCVARKLLAEEGRGPLHTFSAVFDEVPEADERPYINAVVARNRVAPHIVRGDQLSPLDDLDRMLAMQDEPFYAPNLFLHWGLYQAACAAAVRVILDGLDGDTTVSHGIGYLRELAGSGHWLRLAREVWGLSRQLDVSARRILLAKVIKPLLPGAVRLSRTRAGSDRVVAPDLARRVGLSDRVRAFDRDRLLPPRTGCARVEPRAALPLLRQAARGVLPRAAGRSKAAPRLDARGAAARDAGRAPAGDSVAHREDGPEPRFPPGHGRRRRATRHRAAARGRRRGRRLRASRQPAASARTRAVAGR